VNGLFGWANALAFQLGGESVRWSDLLGLATVALAIRRSLSSPRNLVESVPVREGVHA
jgi:hypothetical protein